MDYEKKYKEALRKATKIYRDDDERIKHYMEVLFPELAESEDDRIRKELVAFLEELSKLGKDTNFDRWKTSDCANWIAWLEKQGGTNEIINRDEFAQGVLRGAAINLITWIDYNAAKGNMCLSNMECKDIEDALVNGDWDKIYAYIKKKLDKQGEQKPQGKSALEAIKEEKIDNANKIEPKFKVGDWIMDKESKEVFYISKNLANTYKIVDIEGNDYHVPHYILEEDYDVWTIQDAKPGDVLVDVYGNIGIFEKRYGINWHTYCYLGCEGRFISEGGSHGSICYPATKEQRDTLERAITNAGYRWNKEELKLEKI